MPYGANYFEMCAGDTQHLTIVLTGPNVDDILAHLVDATFGVYDYHDVQRVVYTLSTGGVSLIANTTPPPAQLLSVLMQESDSLDWAPALYTCELQLRMAGNDTFTVLQDQFRVKKSYVTAGASP